MHYVKAYNIVLVQLNDKETADNKNINILSDKQHYSFRKQTIVKKCSNLCFIGKKEGKKRLFFSPKTKQKWLIGIS